jgi:histidine triad (HIT) family protein
MDGCVFCKIAKGDIPSHTIYEDSEIKAFLDIQPSTPGHTLIIPREHYEGILDLPEELLLRITGIARKLAKHYKKRQGYKSFNLIQSSGREANQDVMHFHLHLIPRHEGDGLSLWSNMKKGIKPDFTGLKENLKLG